MTLHAAAARQRRPTRWHPSIAALRGSVVATVLVLAVVTGGLVRAWYLVPGDFPLNDGGLFLVMIDEVIRDGFALPDVTSYNGDGIPFAYPPLGFYLAGLVSVGTGAEPTSVIGLLPGLVSMATVPAAFFLARVVTGCGRAAAFAALFFGLMPASFTWMIMGGGATRAPGYLLAIAAVAVVLVAFRSGARRQAVLGGALFGLAALTHVQFAWYAAVMLLVAFAFHARSVAAWKAGLMAGMAAAVVVAPWLAATVARHGADPMLQALGTNGFSDPKKGPALERIVEEQYLPVVGPDGWWQLGGTAPVALGVVGVAASVAARRPLPVAWIALIPLAGSRAAPQFLALALACLGGMAVDLLCGARAGRADAAVMGARGPRAQRWLVLGVAAVVLAVIGSEARIALSMPPDVLGRLTSDERASMRWAADHTRADSRFLTFKPLGTVGWFSDRHAEWFPVLAERPSLATLQGREWLPGFRMATRKYEQLQNCAEATAACLEAWETRFGEPFTHVYIPKSGPQPRLRRSLDGREDFALVYDGPAAWIYHRHGRVGVAPRTGPGLGVARHGG